METTSLVVVEATEKEYERLNGEGSYTAGAVTYSCPKTLGSVPELKSQPQRIKTYMAEALKGYEKPIPVETIHVAVEGEQDVRAAIFTTNGQTYRSISRLRLDKVDDMEFMKRLAAARKKELEAMMAEEEAETETKPKAKTKAK